jgi:hypothetical protein
LVLVITDLCDTVLKCARHFPVHGSILAFTNEVGCPTIANEESLELNLTDTSQNSGVIDLVAVQVEYGKDSAIRDWVEKFRAVPRSRQLQSC